MTVATDLATAVGKPRRAFLKIAGHQPPLWQRVAGPDGSDEPLFGRIHPLEADVIACWRMNGATGANETDASGNGHTATDHSANCPSVAGKFGTARRVGYKTAPYYYFEVSRHADLEPAAALTVCAWIYIEKDDQTWSGADIIRKKFGGGESYILHAGNTNDLTYIQGSLTLDDGGAGDGLALTTVDNDHRLTVGWHHVALTWNGTAKTATLYLDGDAIETAVGSYANLIYSADDLYISGTLSSIDGYQDDTAIYGTCKSAAWIKSIYANGHNCLRLKKEWSHSLDLAEMKVKGSNMTFVLDDIDDPADPGKSYFGKLFAPGRWDASTSKSTFLRRKSTGIDARQLDADATTINVVKTDDYDNMPTAGEAHVGQECFSYTGKGTDATGDHGETLGTFTGVTKGLYPAFTAPRGSGTTTFGHTYLYPGDDDASVDGIVDGAQIVSDVPFSWLGRPVGLYMTTWDDANNQWHSEDDAELVWAGRISDSIKYDPREGWQLQCRSILDDLNKKIGAGFPRGQGQLVNLNGTLGRKFIVTWHQTAVTSPTGSAAVDPGIYAYCEVEIAAGYWTLYELGNKISNTLNTIGNWINVATGAAVGAYPFFWWMRPKDNGGSYWSVTAVDSDYRGDIFKIWPSLSKISTEDIVYNSAKDLFGTDNPCHAIQAFGFNIAEPIRLETDDMGGAKIAADKAYHSYQPMHLECNGSKMLVQDQDANGFWDTQGDYDGNDWAVVMADAIPYGVAYKDKGKYYVAYTAQAQAAYSVFTNMGFPTTVTATQFTLATAAHQIDAATEQYDKAGFVGCEDNTAGVGFEVQQVYIPKAVDQTFARVGGFKQLLFPMLSTGDEDYNDSTYDKCPVELSVGIPSSLVDTASFLSADHIMRSAYPAASQRSFTVVSEATSMMELIKREAQLFGYALVWDTGKLRIKSIFSPELQSRTVTLDESNTFTIDDYPAIEMGIGTVINTRRFVINNDIHTGKSDTTYMIRDVASIAGLDGITKEMKITHPGIRLMQFETDVSGMVYEDLLAIYHQQAHFTRYPWQQIRRGLAPTLLNKVAVGDIVTLVYNTGFQDPFGTGDRDINALAIVIDVSWNYADMTGHADLLIYSRYDATQVTPWAPSALVDVSAGNAGWDTANDRLTLVAAEYGIAGDPDDGVAFSAGDKLTMYESNHSESNLATTAATTGPFAVTVGASGYDADNQYLYVDTATATALDATFDTGGDTEYVLTFADWDTAVAAQQSKGLWQADKQSHLLNSADDAQRWG